MIKVRRSLCVSKLLRAFTFERTHHQPGRGQYATHCSLLFGRTQTVFARSVFHALLQLVARTATAQLLVSQVTHTGFTRGS